MSAQNYHNHIRFYKPHHFVFYPLVLLFMILSLLGMMQDPENRLIWAMFLCLWIVITWVAFMLRQHYALTLQNRIVVLELRLRYYQLTQQDFVPFEQQLSFGQVAALRFAPDSELLPLLQRTLKENLRPNDIKQQIKNWKADHKRV